MSMSNIYRNVAHAIAAKPNSPAWVSVNSVKSNDYEPIRAAAGINLLTDEGDSWAAHRATLSPTFARRHLNEIADLMIDPIERVTADPATLQEFDTRGLRATQPDPPHSPRRTLVAPPAAFDSTRFSAHAAEDRPRSAYLPFGGGRRICIAQSFALMEMVLMAAIMSQRSHSTCCPIIR